jgi:hypothetical protein
MITDSAFRFPASKFNDWKKATGADHITAQADSLNVANNLPRSFTVALETGTERTYTLDRLDTEDGRNYGAIYSTKGGSAYISLGPHS